MGAVEVGSNASRRALEASLGGVRSDAATLTMDANGGSKIARSRAPCSSPHARRHRGDSSHPRSLAHRSSTTVADRHRATTSTSYSTAKALKTARRPWRRSSASMTSRTQRCGAPPTPRPLAGCRAVPSLASGAGDARVVDATRHVPRAPRARRCSAQGHPVPERLATTVRDWSPVHRRQGAPQVAQEADSATAFSWASVSGIPARAVSTRFAISSSAWSPKRSTNDATPSLNSSHDSVTSVPESTARKR